MESVNGSKNREREMKRKKEDENKKGFWKNAARQKFFRENFVD